MAEQVAVRQRQLEERTLAEARRLAEQESQRLEAERQEAARKQQQLAEERALAEARRPAEQERQRLEAEPPRAQARRKQGDFRLAGAGRTPAKARLSQNRLGRAIRTKRARAARCVKSCRRISRRGGMPGARHHAMVLAHAADYLCAWRWFSAALAELSAPHAPSAQATRRRHDR